MLRLMALLPLFLANLVGSENAGGLGQTTLQIDPRKTFQTIDGFGASDAWAINPMVKKWIRESNDRSIDKVADLLFSTQMASAYPHGDLTLVLAARNKEPTA